MINEYFDKIYCVNLAKRPDKWNNALAKFKEKRIIAERFEGMDGSLISPQYLRIGLSPGEYGCLMSHLNILNDATINNYEKILIFEDDVEFHPDFNKIAIEFLEQVPDDWDMLYFGANTTNNQSVKISDRVNLASNLLTTHAYAVKNTVFEKLIKKLCEETSPVDRIYSRYHIFMNTYLCEPKIAWQEDGWSDVNNQYTQYDFLKIGES